MRVLHLVPQAKQPGKLSAYTFIDEEILGLADAGVEPYVLSTRAERDTEAGPVKVRAMRTRAGHPVATVRFLAQCWGSIPPVNVGRPRELHRALAIERAAAALVQAEAIDVIHSHFGWPGSFGGLLARAVTGRPLVACLRGADVLVDVGTGYGRRMDSYHDRTIRRLLATADRTVYFSEFMRATGVSLGAPADRTRVVRKGVDLTRFNPVRDAGERAALKRALGLPDRPMLLTVAGLIRRKGIHHLLEAACQLRDTHDVSLVICGEGVEREALEHLAVRLGVRDRTCFTGRVDREKIARYFSACDIFVLASTVEAAGNVLLEAMAAARPVVCTAAGGPGEYVSDGETGFVVPVGNVGALASRLRQLLDAPALADDLGARGHQVAAERFRFGRMTDEIAHIYDDITSEVARTARRELASQDGQRRSPEEATPAGLPGEAAPTRPLGRDG